MVKVVNIIGSGDLHAEFDLNQLSEDIDLYTTKYDPDNYPGLYLRFEEDTPLITVYRTGKYIITGAKSLDELYETQRRFLDFLKSSNIIDSIDSHPFSIQNMVCTGDLGYDLNLNALAIGFGLENVEYEPEQFPGLIYRLKNHNGVALLFATGKVVITGLRDEEVAENAFIAIQKQVEDLK